MAKYTVVCLFFLVLADKVLNFLDLLATTFPGKENRRDFRTLAMDLRRDPTLNNLDRSAFMLFIWSSSKIFDVFMWCIFRKERTLNFRCITLRPLWQLRFEYPCRTALLFAKSSIGFDRWDSRIDNLKIGSFAPVQEFNWPAANIEKGTEREKNHFTNGLWTLFHVLSVSQAPSRQSPYDIMEGIYSFVTNFFRYVTYEILLNVIVYKP